MPHRTLSEFALIARYFQRPNPLRHAVLGVGDDCALMQPPAGELLAISTDTLVAGRHFFDDVDPATLGHKALAVNLSDLAASGAQPLACTLALTVPAADVVVNPKQPGDESGSENLAGVGVIFYVLSALRAR